MHPLRKTSLYSLILGLTLILVQIPAVYSQTLPPHKLIRFLTAEVVNQELIDQGRATLQTLPFLNGSQVTELRTTADGYYIRYFAYDPDRFHNGSVGGWIMLTTDVLGKSMNDVKNIFALPRVPDHFVVVRVPAGTLMRTGTAGPISGWGLGGGQQILLMDYIDVNDYQTIASLPGTVRTGFFTNQSSGRNAKSTAVYLDSLDEDNPFAYLQIARLSLYYLESSAFDIALNNIGPERYDALNRAGTDQGYIFNRTMLDPSAQGMNWKQQGSFIMWGGITGGPASYDNKEEHTGFDLVSCGVMTGIDYLLNSHLSVGFGAGYLQSDLDFAQNGGDGTSRSINLGFRGAYQSGPLYIAVQISGATLDEKLNRELVFSGVDRTAHGDLDGYRLSMGMEVDWKVEFEDNLAITPYAGLSLVHLFHQGFTEINAEDLNLKVQGYKAQTLAPELGIRLTKEFMISDNLPLVLKAGLAYAPRFPLDDRKIEASLAGQGGSFFALGQDEELHVCMPSISLSAKTMSGIEINLGYIGNLSDYLNSHTFTSTLSFQF